MKASCSGSSGLFCVQAQVKQMQVCECKRKCVFSRFVGLSTRRGAAARLEDRRLGSHRKAKHSQIFATSNKAAIAPQNLTPTCPAGPTGVLFRVLMFRFLGLGGGVTAGTWQHVTPGPHAGLWRARSASGFRRCSLSPGESRGDHQVPMRMRLGSGIEAFLHSGSKARRQVHENCAASRQTRAEARRGLRSAT